MLDYLNNVSYPEDPNFSEKKALEICFPDAKCNMNCEYCFGNHKTRSCNNSRPLNKEALKEQILPIKDKISFVHLWGGEIIYNKEFFLDAVSFIHDILPETHINLVSNGLLLPEWVDFLVDNKIDIALSHDGPGQKYRGFDFLESEKHVKALLKMYNANLFKTFKLVIHNKNHSYKDINEYFDRFNAKYNIDAHVEGLLIQSNDAQAYIFKPEDYSSFKDDIIWMVRDIITNINNDHHIRAHYSREQVYSVINAINLAKSKPARLPGVCMGTKGFAFTSDGKKVPCHCFVEMDGSIQDFQFNEAEYFKSCIGCKVAPLCNGGCVAKTLKNKKDTCTFSYFYYSVILDTVNAMLNELKDSNNE